MTTNRRMKRKNQEYKLTRQCGNDDYGCLNNNQSNNEQKDILCFQDFFHYDSSAANKINCEEIKAAREPKLDTAEIFFELANAPIVGYRISLSTINCGRKNNDYQRKKRKLNQEMNPKNNDNDENNNDTNNVNSRTVLIRQDNSCQTHTGGIVWETSYLLATYLLSCTCKNNDKIGNNGKLGKTLEVGSGCGMLGLILASSGLCTKVVMTETKGVMPNLLQNVEYNKHCLTSSSLSVRQLRWDALKDDIKYCQQHLHSNDLNPHTFDTIVGTDVIFSPCLVKPLLKTLRKMSHDATRILLCVQIRCEDSHSLFLKKAIKYDLMCDDVTDKLRDFPSCFFGLELDCKLLFLTLKKEKK